MDDKDKKILEDFESKMNALAESKMVGMDAQVESVRKQVQELRKMIEDNQ